jgi:hypothetical protein
MKYFLTTLFTAMLLATPSYANHEPIPEISSSCSHLCLQFSVQSGSTNAIDSVNSSFAANNIRWQFTITWRLKSTDNLPVNTQKAKQILTTNQPLIAELANHVFANDPAKNNLAKIDRLAAKLAPKLGYQDHQRLIADMRRGAINITTAPIGYL